MRRGARLTNRKKGGGARGARKKAEMKLLKRSLLLSLLNSFPREPQIYLRDYGSLLGLYLVVQIITGVTLAILCVAS